MPKYDYEGNLVWVERHNEEQIGKFPKIKKGILVFVSGCLIPEILEQVKGLVSELGFREAIEAKGFSIVRNTVEAEKPEAVIGIACFFELEKAFEYFIDAKIPSMGIPLNRDGCGNTDVDLNLVKQALCQIFSQI